MNSRRDSGWGKGSKDAEKSAIVRERVCYHHGQPIPQRIP
jgi:hypothetical protein